MNVRASGWEPAYRFPPLAWVLLVVGLVAALAAFHSGLADMVVTLYRGRRVGTYPRGQASMQRVVTDITHPVA